MKSILLAITAILLLTGCDQRLTPQEMTAKIKECEDLGFEYYYQAWNNASGSKHSEIRCIPKGAKLRGIR